MQTKNAATSSQARPGLSDLHRHLDGSLRLSTLRELADVEGLELPADIAFHPGMGLEGALARFELTLAVLQSPEAVLRVAAEICEDAEREGVTCLEIRFAPQLHEGGLLEEIVDAALEGIDGRAGLILCALYGEPVARVESLVDLAAPRPGVVAIDLAGGPSPGHAWRMADYAPAFRRAEELGIGRTVHAGEGRPPAEIAEAIEVLRAQRIGHGTSLLEDPEVLQLVLDREVTIEACPTSNVHTGAIARLEEHPLPHWLGAGVRVCINTDNTLFSELDAPAEYRRAMGIPGMGAESLGVCVANGHAGAFRRG